MTKLTKQIKMDSTMIDVVTVVYKNGEIVDYLDDDELQQHLQNNKDDIDWIDEWTFENKYN